MKNRCFTEEWWQRGEEIADFRQKELSLLKCFHEFDTKLLIAIMYSLTLCSAIFCSEEKYQS